MTEQDFKRLEAKVDLILSHLDIAEALEEADLALAQGMDLAEFLKQKGQQQIKEELCKS